MKTENNSNQPSCVEDTNTDIPDYQYRLNESVADKVKEQISHSFLDPFFGGKDSG